MYADKVNFGSILVPCNNTLAPEHSSLAPGTATTVMHIFPDYIIPCDGYVDNWKFYAVNNGTFYIDLWETVGNDSFKLWNSTEVYVNTTGMQPMIINNEKGSTDYEDSCTR